ncbi:MAG: hypothetical protein Q8Q29_07565 [Actinomycetota bacterium]|nr:hypothetical protein [Actinomycetota bacterium]
MGDRTQNDLYADPLLTALSIGFTQDTFIGKRVIPDVPVLKEEGKYNVFGREFLKRNNTRRADKSEANRVSWSLTEATYTCEAEALGDLVSDRERKNADPASDPEEATVHTLTQGLMLEKEFQAKEALFTAANYGANTVSPGTKWDNSAGDPLEEIETRRRQVMGSSGARVNKLVLGRDVFAALKFAPQVLDAMSDMAHKVLTEEVLAQLTGIPEVIVGEAVYDTAPEGATESISPIWGSHAALIVVPERPGLRVPSVAYRFVSEDLAVYRARAGMNRSDYLEVQEIYTTKFTSVHCGFLFTDVLT